VIDFDLRSDIGAALALITLLATAALLRRLPRFIASRRARTLITRWLLPATELAIAGFGAGWLLRAATRGVGTETLVAGTLLVLGLAWAFRTVLHDFASGIALRMDGQMEPGSWIRTAGTEGRIRRVGYRSLEIETTEGTRLHLPFSVLANGRIEHSAEARAARAHTFTIEIPRARPLDRIFAELPALALLSPWASPARPPEVRLLDENADVWIIEVTATSIDPAFASQIEGTVRRELARLSS
jgi:small-conductance mechanosensitive channel